MTSPSEPVAVGEDPGWRPALGQLLWVLVPPVAFYRRQRQLESGRMDGLIALRTMTLSFALGLVLINFVVYMLDRGGDTGSWSNGAGVALVVTNGLLDLLVVHFWRRPLDCADDARLAASYRTRFFLRLAFAESAALVGFVAFLLTGNGLMYPLGLAFSLAACPSFLPTAGRLEREQEELTDNGCARSLVAALRSSGPAVRHR